MSKSWRTVCFGLMRFLSTCARTLAVALHLLTSLHGPKRTSRHVCFEEAVREPGANAVLHLEYGYMLDSLSREARAITQYNKALTLGLPPSDRASCLICLASSYRNRKRYNEALSTIERAALEFQKIRSSSVFTL